MPLQIRLDGDTAIVSNFGALVNDPRYPDAGRDVADLLAQGVRKFVLDLRDARTIGTTDLALLTTITRRIRRDGGEIVLSGVNRRIEEFLEEMTMDAFWDIHPNVGAAVAAFQSPRERR
jgi:anti-sigma B factor antagonist